MIFESRSSAANGTKQGDHAPTEGRSAESARTAWLAGAALGALGGFLILAGGVIGLAFLAVAALVLLRERAGAFGLAGLMTGVGAMWVAVFGRVKLACSPAAQCQAPTIDGWLLFGVAVLVLALALTVVALRRPAK